jgi:hypothetical protein
VSSVSCNVNFGRRLQTFGRINCLHLQGRKASSKHRELCGGMFGTMTDLKRSLDKTSRRIFSACSLFLIGCLPTRLPRRWRQCFPPKRTELYISLHGFISRKTVLFSCSILLTSVLMIQISESFMCVCVCVCVCIYVCTCTGK